MAAHRYWRLTGFAVGGNAPLELSEVRLCVDGVVADTGAVLSATLPPSSVAGVVALRDGSASEVVAWGYLDRQQAGFALVWDFGTGAAISLSAVQLGSGYSADTFPIKVIAQWSDDGAAWTTLSEKSPTYPGALALTSPVEPAYSDTILSDTPIAYWKLDELSGSVMTDSSGNSRNGVYGGLATLGGPPLNGGGASIVVSTTGSATVATIADDVALRLLGDFSIEVWLATMGSSGRIFTKEYGGARYPSWCLELTGGRVSLDLRSSNGPAVSANVISPSTINNGTARHIVATKQGQAVKLYVDGALVASTTYTGSIWASTDPVGLGCAYAPGYGTSALVGTYDNAAIYDYALSAARIDTHYRDGVGSSPSLVGGSSVRRAEAWQGLALPIGAMTSPARPSAFMDAYNGGVGIVYGTVKEKGTPTNTPLRRRMLLVDEASSMTIRKTWSDAVTGNYEFRGVKQGVTYTVLSYDYTGAYRAVVADGQIPELIP